MLISFLGGGLGIASAHGEPPSRLKIQGFTWTPLSSGVRTYNLIDVYQCVLYISNQNELNPDQRNKKQLIASLKSLQYPMALRVEILTSMLPEKMPGAWRETIQSEVTGKAFRKFKKGFAGLDEGDILFFMYKPGESTRLFLNNEQVFEDPGSGLMEGLIDQWLGSRPISEDLKQALLGE